MTALWLDAPSIPISGVGSGPYGNAASSKTLEASEALAAGDWVNIWNDGGTAKARKANAAVPTRPADGYVLASANSGASASVFVSGINSQVSSQTPGVVYLQTTAGVGGSAVPSVTGQSVQLIGIALSATEVFFVRGEPIELA